MANWVLLSGWAMPPQSWQPCLAELSALGQLQVLDYRGLQSSDLAGAAAELLRQASARANWLGWSLGGRLAMEAAAQAPQRVQAVVTLTASPCFVDAQLGMPAAVFNDFVAGMATQPELTLKRFAGLVAQHSTDPRAALRQVRSWLAQNQTEQLAHIAAQLSWLADDQRARWQQVQVPHWHLLQRQDALLPAALAQVWQPHAYLAGGHLSWQEQVGQWLPLLQCWLQQEGLDG
ncbi:alpha/beta fold hydrolase [Balneatrix alpica]|uniref:alpha/beta fold hydrolase n=1 Tax=Balneatrix alpica TaxID=75684 RepID=UPI0027387749|nr:alpha/beta fold hydrolase [Balneatrix alpica]